jgi:hypothetical protein
LDAVPKLRINGSPHQGGNDIGRDEVTRVLRNEAQGEEMPKLTYEEMDYEPMDIGFY